MDAPPRVELLSLDEVQEARLGAQPLAPAPAQETVGKRLRSLLSPFEWAVATALVILYAALLGAVAVDSIRDGTPGPATDGDDGYFDRHAEVLVLGATGSLVLAFALLHAEGPTLAERVEEHRLFLGLTVLVFGFAVAIAQLWERKGLEGAAMLGLTVLATTLLGGNILSRHARLEFTEVRTAITLATVSMFFALVGFAPDTVAASGGVLAQAMEHFWAVVAVVVGFYFGGHTLERIKAAR